MLNEIYKKGEVMFLTKYFFKIYRFFTFKYILNVEKSEPDTNAWYGFLNSIKEPQNNLERCYAKYLCRMYYFDKLYIFAANLAAICAFLINIPVFFRSIKTTEQDSFREGFLLIKESNVGYEDIIPNGLYSEYGEPFIISKPSKENWLLTPDAKIILKQSFRKYPLSFYFNFIIFKELALYSPLLIKYKTKAIVTYVNERNIASPILSELCEKNLIDFVTFMHGEYILQLIQGFMRFTKFYVWDEHYVDMFKNDLRCTSNKFIVYTPKKYCKKVNSKKTGEEFEFYATYYFGAESRKRIEKVSEAFNMLKEKGKKCKVRPHPRHTNLKAIKNAFKEFLIEDPLKISLSESIDSSEYIIALSSTVLTEAYYNGKSVVIDDYSEPERYQNLKKRKYIMLEKPHLLLSDLLKEKTGE